MLSRDKTWYQIVLPLLLAMFTIVGFSFLWTQYNNPGIRKLAGVKQLLRNAADEMTLVLTDVESTQALSQWNPVVRISAACPAAQRCPAASPPAVCHKHAGCAVLKSVPKPVLLTA